MIGRAALALLGLVALGACRPKVAPKWPFAVVQSSGIIIVTELPEAANRLRNATLDHGTFMVKDGCLQVRTLSGVLTPIFPRGSSFDLQRMEVVGAGGRRVQTGRQWQYGLPFAQELGGEVASVIGLPRQCSQRLLTMGAPSPDEPRKLPCYMAVSACDGRQSSNIVADSEHGITEASSEQAVPLSANGGSPDGVRLALLQPSASTDMAALEGVLRVDGPCLYVTGPNSAGSRTTPAFSFTGIRWNASTQALQVQGASITDGTRVRLTGGTPPNPGRLSWAQKPDPSCDLSDVFVTGAIEPLTNSHTRPSRR